MTLTRNALGQVASLTTKKNATAATVNIATAITWKPMSDLVASFTFGNGLVFRASYDQDYRLRLVDGAADVASRTHLYLDGVNLTRIADPIDATATQNFGYSALNQLKTAVGPYGAYTYGYDLTGNRTSEAKTGGPAKVLNYPSTSNRPFEERIDVTQSRAFEYDGAGNTTRGLPASQVYTLEYNNRGRPSALQQNGNPFASYLYNGLEQLASRTVSQPTPATTHYIYDLDGHLIAEAAGASAASAVLTREYIWLEGLPIAVIDGVNTATPVTYYVHTDHLTRPIRMTDQAKATVWSASWLPYGAATNITGTLAQNLRFPGQYFLIEQGLAYNWHRFYDPTTGRYTQPDPLGFPDGPSRYAYAKNNPLMRIDRDGLETYLLGGGANVEIGGGVEVSTGFLFNPGDLGTGECSDFGVFFTGGLGVGLNAGIDAFFGTLFGSASNLDGLTIGASGNVGPITGGVAKGLDTSNRTLGTTLVTGGYGVGLPGGASINGSYTGSLTIRKLLAAIGYEDCTCKR